MCGQNPGTVPDARRSGIGREAAAGVRRPPNQDTGNQIRARRRAQKTRPSSARAEPNRPSEPGSGTVPVTSVTVSVVSIRPPQPSPRL